MDAHPETQIHEPTSLWAQRNAPCCIAPVHQVSDEDLERARDLRHISSTVNAVQRREADHYIAQQVERSTFGRGRGGGVMCGHVSKAGAGSVGSEGR